VQSSKTYEWKESSTYIHEPPYFKDFSTKPAPLENIKEAHCLLFLGDSITTDHISPAGKIANNCPTSRYLLARKIEPKDFNTYGARRGNDEVMVRGTFANVRLINKLSDKTGPFTRHLTSDKILDVYDAAMEYKKTNTPLIIIAGKEYGSGSSRDWAAK